MTSDELYNKLKKIHFGDPDQWGNLKEYCDSKIDLINSINELKERKNAIVVAHTYVPSDIIYGVADYVGDSYELSRYARDSKADFIVYSAVRFMGETAKILSPDKKVIVPADDPGCTLADSITGEDVLKLRQQYPDFTFACYINTTADVKAACDIVVTSSNVYNIMEHYPSDKIYFVPDKLMGANIIEEMERRGVKKEIRLWDGTCYVHEEFDFDQAFTLKKAFPDIQILAHPECKPNVIENSDYTGSTSQIYDFIKKEKKGRYIIFSECGLASRLEVEQSEDLVIQGPCHACKYMKSNSLENIYKALTEPDESDFIEIEEDIRVKAQRSLNEMFRLVDEIKGK